MRLTVHVRNAKTQTAEVKAKDGTVKKIKKAQSGDRVTVDKKGLYTRLGKYKTDAGDRFYKSTSGDIAGTKDMNDFKAYKKSADSVRSETLTPEEKKTMR